MYVYIKYFISYGINNTKKGQIVGSTFPSLHLNINIYFLNYEFRFFSQIFWAFSMKSPGLQIQNQEFWVSISHVLSTEFSYAQEDKSIKLSFHLESMKTSVVYCKDFSMVKNNFQKNNNSHDV